MPDKLVRTHLFGSTAKVEDIRKSRTTTWRFPSSGEGDEYREITFPAADGLVLYFIKRIEKLEREVALLKPVKK